MKWFKKKKYQKEKPAYQQNLKEIEVTIEVLDVEEPVEIKNVHEPIVVDTGPTSLFIEEPAEAKKEDFVCDICQRSFNTERGLKIHKTRTHKLR